MNTGTVITCTRVRRFAAAVVAAAAILATCVHGTAQAQRRTQVTTEWGVKAGASYSLLSSDLPAEVAELRSGAGGTAGLHMAVVFNERYAIQPELIYTYSAIKATDAGDGFRTSVRCNSLRMPVLFSLRLSSFRLHAGPVFSLMDNPIYVDRNGERAMFGRITPTVSYAAGAGVCIVDKVLIDLRYRGSFNRMTNCWSPDASHSTDFRTQVQEISLCVGYIF